MSNKFNNTRNSKLLSIGSATLLALFINNALAINAITVNPIQGRAPVLILGDSAKDKLGINLIDPNDPVGNQLLNGDDLVEGKLPFPKDKPLKDVIGDSDGLAPEDFTITDADGDADNNGSSVSLDKDKFVTEWFNGAEKLDIAALGDKTLCDIDPNGDFSVKVTGNYIGKTEFGLPNSVTVLADKTYPISVNCKSIALDSIFLKPLDSNRSSIAAGIYQPNEMPGFIPEKGFTLDARSSAGKTFPTTGFKDAKFDIVLGAEPASNFDFAIDDANVAEVDINGRVSLKNLGAAKITVKEKGTNNVVMTHDFKIEKWFTNTSIGASTRTCTWNTTSSAPRCEDLCEGLTGVPGLAGSQFKVPTARDFTNSKTLNSLVKPMTTDNDSEYGRRGVGYFVSEWGRLDNYGKGGEYSGVRHVTRHTGSVMGTQAIVNFQNGKVDNINKDVIVNAICVAYPD